MAKLAKASTKNVELTDRELLEQQQKEIESLRKMVESTGDANKVRDFNRRTSQPKNYSYSM